MDFKKPGNTQGDLPILAHREEITAALDAGNTLVLSAPPGTGKSTQVPRFLLGRPGRILVLQPRRIAARNLALRVAEEMGEAVGGTVGYQVRFEGKSGESTRILYQTYGVFFQQLLGDPLLMGTGAGSAVGSGNPVGTIVLDEFHERALEADASLAWVRRLQAGERPDLRLVVMSATLELEGLRNYLTPAPVLEISARAYPVDIQHQPPTGHEPLGAQAARALKRLWNQGLSGSVLVFMPGQGEIRRTVEALDPLCRQQGLKLYELHGGMDMEAQQRALRGPSQGPCVIVSTNVAETSLTIPGITAVIDSGLARIAAYNPQRDMNTLYLGSISRQSALQRAGRAGRTAPGTCVRLWAQDRERAMPEALDPEILRVEPTAMALSLHDLRARAEISGIGSGPAAGSAVPYQERYLIDWLTPPSPALWEKAERALERIGAVEALPGSPGTAPPLASPRGLRITETGRALARLPAHPVLGRVLLDAGRAGVGPVAAAMVAVLESRQRQAKGPSIDLFAQGLDLAREPEARHWDRETREAFRQLLRLLGKPRGGMSGEESALRETVTRCWLLPFQDRIAVRQEKTQSFLLADGRKGVVEAGQVPGEVRVILALELHETGGSNQSRQVGIPVVLPCEPAWVERAFPGECRWVRVGEWDESRGRAVDEEQLRFRGLALDRRPLAQGAADSGETERLLVEKLSSGEAALPGFDDEARQLVYRIQLAARIFPDYGLPKLDAEDWHLIYHEICHGKASLRDLEDISVVRALRDYLGPALMALVDRIAPVSMKLSGPRAGRLTYFESSPPELSARLGDFIGMHGRTTILEGRVEVVYDILAPNYRTVQKTSDLTGFWKNTYPEVKKELKRRYPKHPWP